MSFMKKVAGAGGFGLAGLAATKKINPLAMVSPAASLIKGSKKKDEEPVSPLVGGRTPTPVRPRGQIY